jgi:hypothetical protein
MFRKIFVFVSYCPLSIPPKNFAPRGKKNAVGPRITRRSAMARQARIDAKVVAGVADPGNFAN